MELGDYSRFFLALAFVVGLIWAVADMAKRFGLDKKMRGITGAKGRLAVMDVLHLDPKRKLMIVRADDQEYILLAAGDTVSLIDKKKGLADAL